MPGNDEHGGRKEYGVGKRGILGGILPVKPALKGYPSRSPKGSSGPQSASNGPCGAPGAPNSMLWAQHKLENLTQLGIFGAMRAAEFGSLPEICISAF